jgi:GT2 family glycosyltransferase
VSPRVCVVICNYNGKADTLACLESLRHDTYPDKQIVLIDNGSTDGSAEAVAATFAEVSIVRMPLNGGFTGGNNVGLRRAMNAGAKYVFWLNNDTTIEPTTIEELVRAAEEHGEFALLTPMIHYAADPSRPWFAGSALDLEHGVAVHDNTVPPAPDAPIQEIPWSTGCAMFAPAELMSRLGGFDERFFLYWEDVDLSLRVRATGRRIGLVPSARIYHKVSATASRLRGMSRYYYVRNSLLLVHRHASRARRWRALARVFAARSREALREMRHEREDRLTSPWMTLRAFGDYLTGRYGRVVS